MRSVPASESRCLHRSSPWWLALIAAGSLLPLVIDLAWDLTEQPVEFPVCRHRLNEDQSERIQVGGIDSRLPEAGSEPGHDLGVRPCARCQASLRLDCADRRRLVAAVGEQFQRGIHEAIGRRGR